MRRPGSLRSRILVGAALWGGGAFVAGATLSLLLSRVRDRLDARSEASASVPLLLLVAAIGLTAMALVLVRRGLRQLEELGERAAAMRTGAASRLEGGVPSEIEPLVSDLNALLEHHERLAGRTKARNESLAQGLKGPLEALANEADRLATRGEHGAAEALRHQTRVIERHVDLHLAQTRASSSSGGLGVRAPVGPVLDRLVRTLRSLYDGQSVRLDAETEVGATFRGEAVDLEEILGNLLDNACKWAASRVEARCVLQNGELVVTVDDDGPGLDRQERHGRFARDASADESDPGPGLGLAVVRELAEAYGGSIRLGDSPLGGLRATLTLPAAR